MPISGKQKAKAGRAAMHTTLFDLDYKQTHMYNTVFDCGYNTEAQYFCDLDYEQI